MAAMTAPRWCGSCITTLTNTCHRCGTSILSAHTPCPGTPCLAKSGMHPCDAYVSHLPAQVHFESRYCIACFWAGQRPETSFITHFLKTEKCNQFSLARNSTYNPLLLDHYRMSRWAD